jgi:sec-independent protein translocase protein TatC
MTFWDHLADLRICIRNIIVAVAIFSIFFFIFGMRKGELFGFEIWYPFPDMTDNISNLIFKLIRHDLLPENMELFPNRLIDPILINVQISMFMGIVASTPLIYYNIGIFVGPGLYPNEKRMLKIVTFPATFLFVLGCLFSYFLLTPFLIDFMYQYIESMETLPIVSISDFVTFVLMMTLAFGIIFELPIFMIGFTKIGLISSDFWKRHWRMAVIIILVIGAAITPDGSGITMMIVAIPMMVLYLVGYLGSRFVQANKLKKA